MHDNRHMLRRTPLSLPHNTPVARQAALKQTVAEAATADTAFNTVASEWASRRAQAALLRGPRRVVGAHAQPEEFLLVEAVEQGVSQ